jgi:hypothetical protein
MEGNEITVHERILLKIREAELDAQAPNTLLLGDKEWSELEAGISRDAERGTLGEGFRQEIKLNNSCIFYGLHLMHLAEPEGIHVAQVHRRNPLRPPLPQGLPVP